MPIGVAEQLAGALRVAGTQWRGLAEFRGIVPVNRLARGEQLRSPGQPSRREPVRGSEQLNRLPSARAGLAQREPGERRTRSRLPIAISRADRSDGIDAGPRRDSSARGADWALATLA